MTATCPNDGEFQAEPEKRTSQSAHDVATVDANGQHPTVADQLAAEGANLSRDMWDQLAAQPNPAWVATFSRVVLDDPVEVQVCVCPKCGSPIKVG